MSATITDYFNKASNMNGSYPAVATVTAARSTGGSTLSCDDLSSWATDTPVHFSTFKVNTDGTIDTSTQTDWKGIVNGNTITDMTRLAGAADSGNASGDRVELNPTIGWLDDLITGILVSHKQNGALKDNAVTESSIATGAVTNTKLGDNSVTSAKIGTGAISSYDKIGDNVIQSRNIDFTTITEDVNNMPIARKESFGIGYSATVVMVRIGNIVTLYSGTQVDSFEVLERHQLVETIPSGYRPIYDTGFQAVWQAGTTSRVSWEVSANGTMYFTSNQSGMHRYCINATWITNDPFPTSDIPRQ